MSSHVKQKLRRLQEIIILHKQWQGKMAEIEKMRKWVIETEHILSGEWADDGVVLTNQTVAERFDRYIALLQANLTSGENITEAEKKCLEHFLKVSVSLRPRLISCYDVPNLPRTNNDMERSIRGIKTRYRRISGRKNWNAYLLRYGQSIAYFDFFEQDGLDQDAFIKLFCRVDHQTWSATRKHHIGIQRDRLNVFRFRHKQSDFLHELQDRWEHTLD